MALIGNGKRFNVTLGGTVSKDGIYVGDSLAGVYMKSGGSGDVVPVALEGEFSFSTATTAGATKKFAVLDKVYVTSSGVLTNVATTAGNVPLGFNVGAATTSAAGAQTLKVKLRS